MTRKAIQAPLEAYIRKMAMEKEEHDKQQQKTREATEGGSEDNGQEMMEKRATEGSKGEKDGNQGCAAGSKCKFTTKARAELRCAACGHPVHATCSIAISPTGHQKLQKGFEKICKQCVEDYDLRVSKAAKNKAYITGAQVRMGQILRNRWDRMEKKAKDTGEKGEDNEEAKAKEGKDAESQKTTEGRGIQGQEKNDKEAAEDGETGQGGRGRDTGPEQMVVVITTEDAAAQRSKKRAEVSPAHGSENVQPSKRLNTEEAADGGEEEALEDNMAGIEEEDDEDEAVGHDNMLVGNDEVTQVGNNSNTDDPWTEIVHPEVNVVTRKQDIKYCDLQITVNGGGGSKDVKVAMEAVIGTCKDFLRTIQQVNATARLLPWDTKEDYIRVHSLDDFPKDMTTLKKFFKGAKALYGATKAKAYYKVRIECEGKVKEITDELNDFFAVEKGRFSVAKIQAPSTTTIGWLLYSTRQVGVDELEEELTKRTKRPVATNWKRISDGTKFDPDRNTENDARALHVETATEDKDVVTETLMHYYGTASKKFPLGIRMRMVTPLAGIVNTDVRNGWFALRERQAGWCEEAKAVASYDLINESLETVPVGQGKTLRSMIMQIKATTGNTNTPLFTSVNKRWRGSGYVFQFHPAKEMEAKMVVKGLLVRLVAEYGVGIEMYFTALAKTEAKTMKWDAATNRVISEKDKAVEAALEGDDDMHFTKPEHIEIEEQGIRRECDARPEKDYGDNDTIPSLRNASEWRKISTIQEARKEAAREAEMNDERTKASTTTNKTSRTEGTSKRLVSIEAKLAEMLETRTQRSAMSTLSGSTRRSKETAKREMRELREQMAQMQEMMAATMEENRELKKRADGAQNEREARSPQTQRTQKDQPTADDPRSLRENSEAGAAETAPANS